MLFRSTTSAVWLAHALHEAGLRVLLVDADPGGAAKKRGNSRAEQLELLTEEEEEERRRIEDAGWERTRATAYDVIRATEVWNYDAVLIENVIEFATVL